VVALVGWRLLQIAAERGVRELPTASAESGVLRRGQTARELADTPGVYVMRDADEAAVYVGKARRLRSRLAAYVHRPLGPTRRLEGLAAAVQAVDALECQTDLAALVLEDREIRRLQPRFNSLRQRREPRLWLRLAPAKGRRAVRIELARGPESGEGDYLGPFRNQQAAAFARTLGFEIFGRHEPARAWQFLNGSLEEALPAARARQAEAAAAGDVRRVQLWLRRIAEVRDYDLGRLLLPADPRHARYAVVRPGPQGVEGLLIERCLLRGSGVLDDDDVAGFADRLLASNEQRTTPEDSDVVLRWLGSQRPTARLVCLSDDRVQAADAIQDAVLAVLGM
jgi:hypothetical protein